MTALTEFERLESSGLWREGSEAQRRDVIVSFGDASLVLSDLRERVLTHWSLAAVTRLNPGTTPALFGPGADADETLEIEDEVMIDAITKVTSAIERARPHRGRLRLYLLGAGLVLLAALMVFWMPGALRQHTASVVPPSVRTDIGHTLLARIGRVSGQPCHTAQGDRALAQLSTRLLGAGKNGIVVLPAGVTQAAHLPGGLTLLNRAMVEDYEDADVAAGFILAEAERAAQQDPLDRLLKAVGTVPTFKLLTTGALSNEVLNDYAESLLTAPPATLSDEVLLARFEAAGVPSSPYAYALDLTGETVLGLIEADPMRGQTRKPVLADSDWVRLQGICGG
ncbi:hypothetical protein [Actibacterium lipolyticum]|uniref:Uncharacterized protein n=1 Tax=Actibacterium lipolyticum TaxID=1524263 RepID=A0A238JPL7_9RHOB|nr:hypothetical protein [Actibacterium lipolyticum]SMX32134.1 hypothetical protein COL8621_00719 [Actibacterium lipolyticum]